ncbi:MAG: twitching motility protein PilT [Candidatus Omnitrophota bacterium]|jgi:twitching motility protein PilT
MAKLDDMLKKIVELGASDLHFSSDIAAMCRIDGSMQLLEEGSKPIPPNEMRVFLKEVCTEEAWAEFEETHDTDFAYEIADVGRFRANYFYDNRGPGGVFRVIPSKIPTAEELNLPKSILRFCELRKGLVVVTGPTGSGKSTTLAAMMDHILKTRTDHIITIEDPIEFVYPSGKSLVNQRQVGKHTGSFKRALRAALREDPDIVLVGEMRDLETVEIAIETAETGHLVFGTLHTTTASSTINRIVDQFPADRQAQIRTMLADSLKGVVAQNLCKKVGGGRVAALEILVTNLAVAANIRESKIHAIANAMQVGRSIGMQTLNDHLMEHVQNNLVEPNEAYSRAADKSDMQNKLNTAGFAVDASGLNEA